MSGLCPHLLVPVVNAAIRICCRWSSGGTCRPPAPLGARILTNHDHIFQHNMWDHVKWSEEDEENAKQKAVENSTERIPVEEQAKFDTEACKYWDTFYAVHQNKFFKDRNWLFREFPELLPREAEDCLLGSSSSCGVEDKRRQTLVLTDKQERMVYGKSCCLHEGPDAGDFPGKQAAFRILEVGCGAGNSVFPIISSIRGTRTFLYCCDFSPRAVQLVKVNVYSESRIAWSSGQPLHFLGEDVLTLTHLQKTFIVSIHGHVAADISACENGCQPCPLASRPSGHLMLLEYSGFYETAAASDLTDFIIWAGVLYTNCDHHSYDPSLCHAFVHDVCKEDAAFPFPPLSLDIILLVFVMSSIHPSRMQGVVNRLTQFLKPGGMFLFRDYGRYDLSQLRFKKGCCLSENFYSRGDGTCVYFFTKEEVRLLFSNAGLEEIQNLEDRRLQVNRREKVAMRRVWMQSKFQKQS